MLLKNGYLLVFAYLEGDTLNQYLNYPGWEAWKFFNLFLFVGVLIYVLRRPVGASLKARKDSIRQELVRAQEERNAALAKLEEVNARLLALSAETEAIKLQAQEEAIAESARIEQSTEAEMRKLRQQALQEIEGAGKSARQQLRRLAAEQSVQLAEDFIRRDIRIEDDARLVNDYVEELGGIRH